MRVKRLILPGRFVDAYLYFDFAWLFSKDGVVRAFDMARYCADRLNGEGNAASALFSNNQLLSRLQEAASLTQLLASDRPIELTAADVDCYSYIFQTKGACRSILDVRFYNGRAFVGADNGIQQFVALGRDDLQDSQLGRSALASLHAQQVSELPARQIKGRYGAIAAACGPAGGVVGVGASTEDRNWRITFEPITDRCYGIELSGNAVSCLASSTTVELYTVDRKPVQQPSERDLPDDPRDVLEFTRVTGRGFDAQNIQLNQRIAKLSGASRAFLFTETLWVLAEDGFYHFRFVDKGEVTTPGVPRMKEKPPGRVLSASGSKAGIIAESDDEVFVLNENRWHVLISEPVHSVRSYPSSKRYQQLVTAVLRDRVELVAIL